MNLLEDLQNIYENPDKPLKPLSKAGLRYELFVAALHDEVINAWKKYDGYIGLSEKFQALEDVEKTLIKQMAEGAVLALQKKEEIHARLSQSNSKT